MYMMRYIWVADSTLSNFDITPQKVFKYRPY